MKSLFGMTVAGYCAVIVAAGFGCASENLQMPEDSGVASCSVPGEVTATTWATGVVSVAVNEAVSGWRSSDIYAYQTEGWMLEIVYLNRGTRSEGQAGRLYKGGSLVVVDATGPKTLETPIGLLRFYGAERHQPWSITGWNFADRRLVKRSEALPAPPVSEPPAAL